MSNPTHGITVPVKCRILVLREMRAPHDGQLYETWEQAQYELQRQGYEIQITGSARAPGVMAVCKKQGVMAITFVYAVPCVPEHTK